MHAGNCQPYSGRSTLWKHRSCMIHVVQCGAVLTSAQPEAVIDMESLPHGHILCSLSRTRWNRTERRWLRRMSSLAGRGASSRNRR